MTYSSCATRGLVALLLASLLVTGCGESENPATHPSLRNADLPRLISAKTFYGGGYDRWSHKVSPDGEKLAWIQRVEGKLTLRVRVLANNHIVTIDHPLPVTTFNWALDSRRLLFSGRVGTPGNQHLFLADIDDYRKKPTNLTPHEGVNVLWYSSLPGKPGTLLAHMNLRTGVTYDLYEIDLATGANRFAEELDGSAASWVFSRTGKPLARVIRDPDGGWFITVADGGNVVLTGVLMDEIHLSQLVPDDRQTVYLRTDGERNSIAAVALDLDTHEYTVLFDRPDTDITQLWLDGYLYQPLVLEYHDGFPRYHFFDQELGADLEKLFGADPVSYRLTSMSLDRARLTITASTDRRPRSSYLADRRSGELELLAAHPLNEYEETLSPTRPIRFEARDEQPISGYLTLPRGTDGKRLPMVLKVHGGPWLRDFWEFDHDTQFLTNRGYAVLEVNFRGSAGFGKYFRAIGRGEFGGKMQQDLLDAVDWAVAQGYADPEKVAIFGYSYGGYATLVGLTNTPRKFAAGIGVMGVSDLVLHMNTIPPYAKRRRKIWTRFAGNPDDPRQLPELAERSPITHVHRIERPLLIVHGALDTRVSKRNSDLFVEKLREKDIPVDYLVFPDEGHGIAKAKNRVEFARRLETFLAEHLGGRAVRTR